MIRYLIYIIVLLTVSLELNSQSMDQNVTGKVIFITPQNVYVRFKATEGISAGDTLFMISNGKQLPVMRVDNLSSTSCVCTLLNSNNLSVSQDVLAIKKSKPVKQKITKEKSPEKVKKQVVIQDTVKKESQPVKTKQKINGNISAYSYMNFSNTGAKNSTQFRYNFNLDARNIGDSKFSIENYISFRHKSGDWSIVKSDLFNALKIYSLAVRYEPDNTSKITLGRTINYRISSIGAMDGLQFEKTFNKISFGVLTGTRPDYNDYGFNSKLLQYGGYVAFDTKKENAFSETSVAFMEQMNNMKTDRRFLYFQHSNSLLKNVYFFSTFEIDLYKVRLFTPQNTFDLSSFYVSLRYRMTRNFTISGSYDQRKNVLFYETYKSLLDSVYQNEKRQSLRLQANYRITQNLTLGVESGYHFLKSDPHPSKNLYGYLSYSRIPGVKVSITLTGTYLETAYLNGKVIGADISKDFFLGKLQANLGYRYEDYSLYESTQKILQNIGNINLYWQFSRKLSGAVSYEGTFEKHDKFNRLYLQFRKRF